MPPKNIPDAGPLSGAERAIVIQDGKPVRTTTQAIADKAPSANPPVKSVAGKSGDVVLAKADVGLNNVNNTADANKPVSNATQQALDQKADKSQIPAVPPKVRVERYTAVTNANGVATVTFSPAFEIAPDIGVIDGWVGEQMITGAAVAGTTTKTGCQVQVMLSRPTLLLSTGPFQKAAAGVSVTVRAIGN
ncbi:hypothetical protein [Agrobacterium rubi]|uniref:PASTA domain-containing protein n=1 Tax=Agrobacterium rubi TaxID=28099 RepID=A0ABX2IZ17_9HYPH|nr:hypothetical protein [Agrobacterium rubi]NTF35573.1 hypothetical protein [Agrobacterium rubi]